MPAERHGWVRRALNDGRAVVVRRTPFTVQLPYESGHGTQEVTLGADAGSKYIGLSASTEKQDYICGRLRQGDRVQHKGAECFVTARRADGRLTLRRIDGTTVAQGMQIFGRKTKKRQNPQLVRLLETAKAYMTGRPDRQFLAAVSGNRTI